ncbi:MAG: bifunctional UDP-N-acetylglucosamine diphosphorylase/glucosamine-1-phosphate N-acetyltransferase GlmU [Anaerolineae bacterium]|nr:bifunctional UDP-N-acetylglucosamine diphosphorylase/glucosamine-1-phosphate N-acetyltransferase GlmU [Anaerolineae bacterium]
MKLTVVILAAGKSTRFKSKISKVLYPLAGRPMLSYLFDTAEQITSDPPVLVVGPDMEAEIRAWAGDRARYVIQHERLGTGHAVMQTRAILEGRTDQLLILYGDGPLLRATTLQKLAALQNVNQAAIAMMTLISDTPRGFGRILRDANGRLRGIVEEADATAEQLAIRELNPGIYIFDADFLWPALTRLTPSPAKGEYYLTDLVSLAAQDGLPLVGTPFDDPDEAIAVNTRVDLAAAEVALRKRIAQHWMLSGVTLLDPATTYIDADVTIGQDTVIYPNTHLRGATAIGEDCAIGPNTIIENCSIANRCKVLASVLEEAVMEEDSAIGPFGHLRKGARLCQGAHMGNFGEIKNGTLGPGAKMGHFSYLGDAEIGARSNIGAGTITCNFDGQHKHRTVVEEDVFIGSDTLLVAPLCIGEGAKTGAGSVVTHDVPPHTLVYGVPARPRKQDGNE